MATLHPPQFMVYGLDKSGNHWVPEIINYNGSPYMLVGETLDEIYQSWEDENSIDEFLDFRVVNVRNGDLYWLNETHSGFVLVDYVGNSGPDFNWFQG